MKKKQRKILDLVKNNISRLNNLHIIIAGDGDNNTGNNTETDPPEVTAEEQEWACEEGSDKWVLKPKKKKG